MLKAEMPESIELKQSSCDCTIATAIEIAMLVESEGLKSKCSVTYLLTNVSKRCKIEVTLLAKSHNVCIKGESRIHDDIKTFDLIREFYVSTCNFDGWNRRECAQVLACTKKYGFRFIRVEALTVMTEPDAESVQAGF